MHITVMGAIRDLLLLLGFYYFLLFLVLDYDGENRIGICILLGL